MVGIYQLTLPDNINREARNDTAINNRLLELIGYEGQVLNSITNIGNRAQRGNSHQMVSKEGEVGYSNKIVKETIRGPDNGQVWISRPRPNSYGH